MAKASILSSFFVSLTSHLLVGKMVCYAGIVCFRFIVFYFRYILIHGRRYFADIQGPPLTL